MEFTKPLNAAPKGAAPPPAVDPLDPLAVRLSGGRVFHPLRDDQRDTDRMNTVEAPASPTGRERHCAQCSTAYHAPRATSLYCSPRCRKRAHRGHEDTDSRTLDLLRRWLLRRTYAGKIGPVNGRDPRAPIYALTVPRSLAMEEWNGWNPGASMTDAAFVAALDQLGIHGVDYVPPHKRH